MAGTGAMTRRSASRGSPWAGRPQRSFTTAHASCTRGQRVEARAERRAQGQTPSRLASACSGATTARRFSRASSDVTAGCSSRDDDGRIAAARYHGRVSAPTRWPEARAARGLVASPHRLASEAGRAVFARGGNALDAALAAAATIAVVYPHMNGIGGDNFWLIFDARAGACSPSTRRGAPAARRRSRRRTGRATARPSRRAGARRPHRARRGLRLVAARIATAPRRMGSPITWASCSTHAIQHAREGFPPSPSQRRVTAGGPALFDGAAPDEVRRTLWPIFHPDRLARRASSSPDLARTLELDRRGGSARTSTGAIWRGARPRRRRGRQPAHRSTISPRTARTGSSPCACRTAAAKRRAFRRPPRDSPHSRSWRSWRASTWPRSTRTTTCISSSRPPSSPSRIAIAI